MPTVFRFFGMQFYFWSSEHAPIHILVRKDRALAKFTVEPTVELVESKGFKPQELRLAETLIEENRDIIVELWNKWFNTQESNE